MNIWCLLRYHCWHDTGASEQRSTHSGLKSEAYWEESCCHCPHTRWRSWIARAAGRDLRGAGIIVEPYPDTRVPSNPFEQHAQKTTRRTEKPKNYAQDTPDGHTSGR